MDGAQSCISPCGLRRMIAMIQFIHSIHPYPWLGGVWHAII